jgi:hypothetical protein
VKREWEPGDAVPEMARGHVVVLRWNEVALTSLEIAHVWSAIDAVAVLSEGVQPDTDRLADWERDLLRGGS